MPAVPGYDYPVSLPAPGQADCEQGKSAGVKCHHAISDDISADIADKLLRTIMDDKVKVRTDMISIDDKRSITVCFNLLGPKDDYERYISIR